MDSNIIEKLTPSFLVNFGVFIFSFLCPGFLLWYLYAPELIERLDFLKLCVLAVGVSSPTFVIPYALTALIHRILVLKRVDRIELYGGYADWYTRHALINALNMYMLVVFSFLFDIGKMVFVIIIFGVILMGIAYEIYLLIRFLKDPDEALAIQFERVG